MKLKSKKSALLMSFTSLLICFAMLVGSTFAWFTDTATTGVNKIQAGNLDVKLEYKKPGDTDFAEANENTKVFEEAAQWEPNHLEYVVLKVSNAGNLALKYKLGINIANEVSGRSVIDDKVFKLSDYINFSVVDGDKSELTREQLIKEAREWKKLGEGYMTEDTPLYPAGKEAPSEKTVTLVVWMPESVGNEANHKADATAPSVELGINVVATQLNHENDSFSNTYDKDALYPDVTVIKAENAEAVLSANEKVINVALAEDVTFDVEPYDKKPMGGEATEMITIDAQGHKLTFNNCNSDWNNVTWGNAKLVIKNATIDNSGYHANGGTWNNHNIYFKGNVELENVKFTNAVALEGTAVLKNVSISDVNATQDVYMLWIRAGSNVTLENVNINGKSEVGMSNRAIAIKDEYITDPAETTLTINDAKITSDKYAAVYVTSKSATTVNLKGDIDVTGTAAVSGQIVQKSNNSTGDLTVND